MTPNEKFVVQLAVEPQLLLNGYKFSARVYLLAYSPPSSKEVEFYTFDDGWVTKAQDLWTEGSLEWKTNVARERYKTPNSQQPSHSRPSLCRSLRPSSRPSPRPSPEPRLEL